MPEFMASFPLTEETRKPAKTAAERQKRYLERKRAGGRVDLMALVLADTRATLAAVAKQRGITVGELIDQLTAPIHRVTK